MARGRAVSIWPVIVASGKERLHDLLAGQWGMARPNLNCQDGIKTTCIQETGCGIKFNGALPKDSKI